MPQGRHSAFRQRERLVSWRQVAGLGRWNNANDAPPLWTETLPNGWLWGIRGHNDRFMVFVFTDAVRVRDGCQNVWNDFLVKSRLAKRFASWSQLTRLTTQEVTPIAARPSTHRNLIHIGDAALARD